MKKLLKQYLIFNKKNEIERCKEDSKNDLDDVFEDFDENGNVVKTTYLSKRKIDIIENLKEFDYWLPKDLDKYVINKLKEHEIVLKLEIYEEDKFKVEMLSLNDEKIFKWAYDKNGNLKKEEKLIDKETSLLGVLKSSSMRIILPKKMITLDYYKLAVFYDHNKEDVYDYVYYSMIWIPCLRTERHFTVDNPFYKNRKTLFIYWEEDRFTQKFEKYLWNPKLNSYERWRYNKNCWVYDYGWKNISDDLHVSEPRGLFFTLLENNLATINLGTEYGSDDNNWIIKNIKIKDNNAFEKFVSYLLDKREEILKIKKKIFEWKDFKKEINF